MPRLPRFCLLLAAAVPALAPGGTAHGAAAPLESFRLPQGETPPEPDRQGPVAPDVPESRLPPRPQPAPAPSPTPAPVQPRVETLPSPTAAPIQLPEPVRTARPASPSAAAAAAAATPTPTTAPPAAGAEPGNDATAGAGAAPLAFPTGSPGVPTATPTGSGLAPAEREGAGMPDWLWFAAAGAALLAVLGGIILLVRRRRGDEVPPQVQVPQVRKPVPAAEKPMPAASPAPAAEPVPAVDLPAPSPPVAGSQGGLTVEFTPLAMSMTLVNAALGWRVELANHGGPALEDVELAFDMISAHKELSPLERLSGPAAEANRRKLGRIDPGQTVSVEGDMRLPFPRIVPIWHGETALLMPLVRLRVTARGMLPMTRTVMVGQPSPRTPGTLLPFRLDLGPRVYPDLARKAFA